MSTPSKLQETSRFVSVRLANFGSAHTICFGRKNFLPGEGAHLDPANKTAFKCLHFIYVRMRILVTISEAPLPEPAGIPSVPSLPQHRRRAENLHFISRSSCKFII